MACLVPSPEGIQQKKVCLAQRKARESSGETVEGDRGEQAGQSMCCGVEEHIFQAPGNAN